MWLNVLRFDALRDLYIYITWFNYIEESKLRLQQIPCSSRSRTSTILTASSCWNSESHSRPSKCSTSSISSLFDSFLFFLLKLMTFYFFLDYIIFSVQKKTNAIQYVRSFMLRPAVNASRWLIALGRKLLSGIQAHELKSYFLAKSCEKHVHRYFTNKTLRLQTTLNSFCRIHPTWVSTSQGRFQLPLDTTRTRRSFSKFFSEFVLAEEVPETNKTMRTNGWSQSLVSFHTRSRTLLGQSWQRH